MVPPGTTVPVEDGFTRARALTVERRQIRYLTTVERTPEALGRGLEQNSQALQYVPAGNPEQLALNSGGVWLTTVKTTIAISAVGCWNVRVLVALLVQQFSRP